MMKKGSPNQRRRFLVKATSAIGAVGTAGLLIPFIASMNPSARARTAGAPVLVDISRLLSGEQITVLWRGKPVWVLHRTDENIQGLKETRLLKQLSDPESTVTSQQPEYARNAFRSINPDFLVVIALCTHLGCVPTYRPQVGAVDLGADWPGGYFCPCHGSRFDLAGRVFRGVPAPTNLVVPPYRYVSDTELLIGEDPV